MGFKPWQENACFEGAYEYLSIELFSMIKPIGQTLAVIYTVYSSPGKRGSTINNSLHEEGEVL